MKDKAGMMRTEELILLFFLVKPHLRGGRLQGLSKQGRVIRTRAKGLIPVR